jgi:hypothetical protein
MLYVLEHSPISRRASRQGQRPGMPRPLANTNEEGDAFLMRMRLWGVVLLVEGVSQRYCTFGMRHPCT